MKVWFSKPRKCVLLKLFLGQGFVKNQSRHSLTKQQKTLHAVALLGQWTNTTKFIKRQNVDVKEEVFDFYWILLAHKSTNTFVRAVAKNGILLHSL